MLSLQAILDSTYNGREGCIPERLLCLDPGNTTGWCLFINGQFSEGGQITTIIDNVNEHGQKCHLCWDNLKLLFEMTKPTMLVVENYRVYSHKLDRHTFSEVPTVRLIGGIDFLAYQLGLPIAYQMAASAKGFVTDERLKAWNLWQDGLRHCRDAIRHGIYYLVTH